MHAHATATPAPHPSAAYYLFLDILHLAAAQDGTPDTALQALHSIEDLAAAGIGRSCPHVTASLIDGVWVCRSCGQIALLETPELAAADSR